MNLDIALYARPLFSDGMHVDLVHFSDYIYFFLDEPIFMLIPTHYE